MSQVPALGRLMRGGFVPHGLSPYAAAVAAIPDHIGEWRLGEASGVTAADSSGHGLTGTWGGTPTFGTASLTTDPDTAVTLNATQYLSLGDVAATQFTGTVPFSVVAWVKLTSNAADQYIMCHRSGAAGWMLYVRSDGLLICYRAGGPVVYYTALSWGTAYCLAYTYDGTNGRLYANGAAAGDATAQGSITSPAVATVIGALNATTGRLNGILDEVDVWSRAITLAEVQSLYAFHA